MKGPPEQRKRAYSSRTSDAKILAVNLLAGAANRLTALLAIGDNRSFRFRSQDFGRTTLIESRSVRP
jgi:hypothetical protein